MSACRWAATIIIINQRVEKEERRQIKKKKHTKTNVIKAYGQAIKITDTNHDLVNIS